MALTKQETIERNAQRLAAGFILVNHWVPDNPKDKDALFQFAKKLRTQHFAKLREARKPLAKPRPYSYIVPADKSSRAYLEDLMNILRKRYRMRTGFKFIVSRKLIVNGVPAIDVSFSLPNTSVAHNKFFRAVQLQRSMFGMNKP